MVDRKARNEEFFGLAATLLIAMPSLAQYPDGTVLRHNGSLDSGPPGTGEAPVVFNYGWATFGPHNAEYQSVTTHEVRYQYATASPTVFYARALIVNATSVPWSGFEISLQGGDFAGYSFVNAIQAPADNPVVYLDPAEDPSSPDLIVLRPYLKSGFSLATSSIARCNDQGTGFQDSLLTMTFADPLLSNKIFVLWYNIIPSPGAAGTTEFTVRLTPIPEPTTLPLLASLALGTLVRRRRTG